MPPTLCTEDLVVRKGGDAKQVATVERTHADVDTHESMPFRKEDVPPLENDSIPRAAVKQFMRDGVPPKGTVYIRWINFDQAELIAEDRLELRHRSLFIGDVVTRGDGNAMSGVVINVDTRCQLQPMGTSKVSSNGGKLLTIHPSDDTEDQLVREHHRPDPLIDIPASELRYEESPAEDDLVIYKGYIGRILSLACATTIRLTDNSAVEVSEDALELLSDHPDVPRVGDLVRTKKGILRTGVWKYGRYNANTPPIGSVVSTRAVSIEVAWLMARLGPNVPVREPPALLERDEMESSDFHIYNRSRRPPQPHPSATEATISNSEIESSVGLRVRFADLPAAETKYDGSTPHGKLHRIPRQETLGYDMNVYGITSVSAHVSVQWQDLSVTYEPAIDLIPDSAIDDEHAAWPGEIAHTNAMKSDSGAEQWKERPERVGVVQTVNAAERMAVVRWCPDARVAYAKRESADTQDPLSGSRELISGVVGVAGVETEELSLYDIEAPAELNVRRGDVVMMPDGIPGARVGDVTWLGEVVDTVLDGRLLVRLGAADVVQDVLLRREQVTVAIRSDGTDDLEGLADEAALADDSDEESESGYEDDEEADWWRNDPRVPKDAEMEDEEAEVHYEDENGEVMDIDDVEDEAWESAEEGDDANAEPNAEFNPTPSNPPPPPSEPPTSPLAPTIPTTPPPYQILDTPLPPSHPFSTPPTPTTPPYLKRLHREHRILTTPTNLPPHLHLLTWTSRLDCIRALFLGPLETPYADCPFVIDFHFPPTYPHSPPKAFFHSWPAGDSGGGSGRVNPNLYEDGKICLSLLGTWEGEGRSEGWRAGSTLLQVLVSILGLVLVREPYFNEAGYEPLAGLASSVRPSALYNERTVLRSLGFLVRAVEAVQGGEGVPGLEGLEGVVREVFLEGGVLGRVVGRVEGVLERSEREEGEGDGVGVFSRGACVLLRRVLGRLRGLEGGGL